MAAGAALIEEVRRQPHSGNLLLYPILFNYRHGLELAMKWIIEYHGAFSGVRLDKKDHDLWALWKKCKLILELTGPTEDEALAAVEQIVKDLHDLDEGGLSFRYSKDKNGATIPLPNTIDLQNLQEVMEGVDGFFTGADGHLTASGP